jgi:hypothetical protein
MKNLIVGLIVIMTFGLSACGQRKNVPQKVTEAFVQKFPDAKDVKWGKENAKVWEAEFTFDNHKYSANFSIEGTWEETEYVIDESALPEPVRTTLSNEFADYTVNTAEVTDTPEKTMFEIILKNGSKKMEVEILKDGTVVKNDSKKEKEENEGEEAEEDEGAEGQE